jgi:hypothetical protein
VHAPGSARRTAALIGKPGPAGLFPIMVPGTTMSRCAGGRRLLAYAPVLVCAKIVEESGT